MVKTLSVVVPVYRNAESIPFLLAALSGVALRARREQQTEIELVFVVDGSPDASHALLVDALPAASFASQLLLHSRNFGSFAAIRSGLRVATGEYIAVIAADLQEPPELVLEFLDRLAGGQFDLVVGCRENRSDPFGSRLASEVFWRLYKRFVVHDIPKKGVDVFGCNRVFRDRLLALGESNSSLVGLIFWLGFRRTEVMYERRERQHGKSAWTLKKKVNYLLDSVFSFTDLPIRLLTLFGLFGVLSSMALGSIVLAAKLLGGIVVPGYAATLLTVTFFGALNSLGLGIIGTYAWRTFENTKGRPLAVVMDQQRYEGVGINE